ncbi:uncharacterized protein LOC111868372 [Cryptotermes secundus]|uniref:uncharacterized protein LOC111868372 n=1 Tax=Cryptotermes secundus TaxID=105785 RepID=UPI001454CE1F|nr:uncharacterized protein LOC111868372 [Cryptotermes secundus]XP_033608913.1 uncharacterized protein LOC111868372 [Cryptotermes secundus]
MPFCRDPRKFPSGKSSLDQDRQRKLHNQNNVYQPSDCSQLPTLQYRNLKAYGYKKTEVYNPGKARRLEQKMNERSMNTTNNRYSQSIRAELRKYSGDNEWEPISPMNKQPLCNLTNKFNCHGLIGNSQSGNAGDWIHYSRNPIAEMEMKGKESCDTDETDKPPFNFQAMLRKTNVTRASLRRIHDTASEGITRETSDQNYNINYLANDKNYLRSSSTPHNGSNTSKHTSPTSNLSKCSARNPLNENEHGNKKCPKSSWKESEQQERYNSMIPWNDTENSSDSKTSPSENEQWTRFDLKKSQAKNEQYKSNYVNKNEQQSTAISKNYWNESKLKQSESMKLQNEGEHCRRFNTNESTIQNEQHESDNRPDLKKSFNEYEHKSPSKTRKEWKDKTGITITELVPGLIIQGEVADL